MNLEDIEGLSNKELKYYGNLVRLSFPTKDEYYAICN